MPDAMYDPEIPAGFQDADIEQAQMEETGRRISALRKKGICVHGWRQGYTPTANRPDLAPDKTECLDCGKVATDAELDAERARYL